MTTRFDSYIRLLEGDVPQDLIAPASMSAIRRVAHLLPARLSSFFGFECRLGDPRPAADFLLHIAAAEGAATILAGANGDHYLPEFIRTDPLWQRITAFAEMWSQAGTVLAEKAEHIWLEFDTAELAEPSMGVQVPSFFFGVREQTDVKQPLDARECGWVTDLAFPLLWGGALGPELKESVRRCYAALPDGAYVFQMGTMLSRPEHIMRLCIRGIQPGAIPSYLDAIGWHGDPAGLAALLEQVSPLVDRVDLDLDVMSEGTGIGPKIGLECYLHQADEQCAARLRSFLDYLTGKGLCTDAKRRALLAFPGYIHEWEKRELWPENLLQASAFFQGKWVGLLARGIHHIKIVYQEGASCEAKGYLAVYHTWGKPFPAGGSK